MKLFEVLPDDDGYGGNYLINAVHKWSIPGVACPVCGFKGSVVGIAYPDFCLSSDIDHEPYENAWPVTPERIRELTVPFEALTSRGLPVLAGTEFGPLSGKASGRFGDVTWLNDWTPLIRTDALAALTRHGIEGVEVVSPQIELRSRAKPFEHLEICIRPLVRAQERDSQGICRDCGMRLDREPDTIEPYRPAVVGKTFPKALHLARVIEVPAYIVASEQFVDAAGELGLTDIRFEELEVR